ncbi:MAG: hypothetical protein U0183_06925 [Polyangiaceae bacterium]
MNAAATFRPYELAMAFAAATFAQALFAGLFLLPTPEHREAAISDENAKPIAIAVTPVPLLKKGSLTPGKLPTAWERQAPAAQKTDVAQPSAQADKDAPSKAKLDAGVAAHDAQAGPQALAASGDGGPGEPGGSTPGVPNGSPNGTETDPLKGRAADAYRGQLAAWFLAHFMIKGKVPFDELQKLRGEVIVSIGEDRHVGGHSVTRLSGNAVFDAEVEATLTRIRASGAEVPSPPPNYPDLLGRTVTVGFRCTTRSQCE